MSAVLFCPVTFNLAETTRRKCPGSSGAAPSTALIAAFLAGPGALSRG